MSDTIKPLAQIENTSDLFAVRSAKLEELRAQGQNPFQANWNQKHISSAINDLFYQAHPEAKNNMEVHPEGPDVSVAGRIITIRLMGKASFIKILDREKSCQSN